MSLKEELLSVIKSQELKLFEELDKKMRDSNSLIIESNKIIEENKRIIECFLQQKYQIDKIENLEKITNKSKDTLISHEIKISNTNKEISLMKTKYDKIVLDNLLISGYIGPSCQFKNLSSYLKNFMTEFSRLKYEFENNKKETKEFKVKLDGASKNIINLIDGGVLRCNQYTDNRINDFHVLLDNKIKEMNEKIMEMRIKNIQFQTKIEEEIKELKSDYEEKMIKQKDDLSQIIKNKIEYLNMNYLSVETNPKILEIDTIKNNYTQLEKEIKEIKQFIQNVKSEKNINYNYNIINGDSKFQKNKKKMSIKEIDNNFNSFYDNSFKNKNFMRKGTLLNSSNNDKKELVESSFSIKRDKNRDILSPVKSRFYKDKDNNKIMNSSSPKKATTSLKILNPKDINNNNDEKYFLHNDININRDTSNNSIPKKYKTKTNLINLEDKMNLVEKINIYENILNTSKENKSKNKTNIEINDFNNEKKLSKKELIKSKNNYNLTNTINERSHSFISISNSSKNDNMNETQNLMELKPKTLFINKKNIINYNNNKSNIIEKKIATNLVNKSERFNKYKNNKLKNLHIEISDNYNNSKTNSKMNLSKTQTNYKDEIVNELFSRYNKGNITTNLSQIKHKGNLDLYTYSISPPDNFLLNTKISDLYEPPPQEFFFNINNTILEKNSKQYYTKRNLSLKPSLNMQLYYGNYNQEKRKDNNRKINSLSTGENKININIKSQKNSVPKKIVPSFGKTIYSDYVKKEKLFTMTSYKTKK